MGKPCVVLNSAWTSRILKTNKGKYLITHSNSLFEVQHNKSITKRRQYPSKASLPI